MTAATAAGARVGYLVGPVRRVFSRPVVVVIMITMLSAACGAGSTPGVPLDADGQPDATLELGRTAYGARCSSCHGNEGQGGRGKRLNRNRAEELYPDIADMVAVITEGKGSGMPSFEDKLTEEQRLAVARYVREVLS